MCSLICLSKMGKFEQEWPHWVCIFVEAFLFCPSSSRASVHECRILISEDEVFSDGNLTIWSISPDCKSLLVHSWTLLRVLPESLPKSSLQECWTRLLESSCLKSSYEAKTSLLDLRETHDLNVWTIIWCALICSYPKSSLLTVTTTRGVDEPVKNASKCEVLAQNWSIVCITWV